MLEQTTKLDKETKERITSWLEGNYDEETKSSIKELVNNKNEDELLDSFYKELEFGTGGLRGLIGTGSNRMNKYTVGMATQGLSNYLKKNFPEQEIKVAVAHDNRIKSRDFATITAEIFSANGFKVFLFEDLRPTPELSFAIRELGCQSGVVITASHNPKEYNGYKAYWADGGQLIPPHDKNVIEEVNKISDVTEIKFTPNKELIQEIGRDIDSVYLDKIASLSVSKEAIERQKDMKIVFSSIHGTGITLVPEILKKFGFTNVNIVEEQAEPDGNFPTVKYPNPEESEAMSLGLAKAKEIDADLLMATDPDSDRVGIAVKNQKGEWQLLNGNQTGSLLIGYMIRAWKEAGKISGKEYVVKTIVTSDLISRIAEKNGVKCYETLTGFKYIAAKIKELEGKEQFIAGGEESYGYLVGDDVRDKDAIASCAFIAEMVAWAKDKGKSVFDELLDLYEEYGFYKERLVSLTKKGKSGADEIQQMMKDLREKPPKTIGSETVSLMKDYQSGLVKNLESGQESDTGQPKSNVLQFLTKEGSLISARPSGTEPKIKFYVSVNKDLPSKEDFEKVNAELEERINSLLKDFGL